MKEEIVPPSESSRQDVVALIAAPDPNFESVEARITSGMQFSGKASIHRRERRLLPNFGANGAGGLRPTPALAREQGLNVLAFHQDR